MELELKLGVEHAASTVRKYMVERGGPRLGSTWRQSLQTHAHEIFTLDFATQVLWNFDVRYILAVMALDTPKIVHVGVTASPTLDWLKLRLREAFADEADGRGPPVEGGQLAATPILGGLHHDYRLAA